MPRSFRTRRLRIAAAAAGLAALAMLASSAAAPAATDGAGRATSATASHQCLVMTGSGDPAFTKNFNPYAGGGLPSNAFAQGAMYEPLIVVPSGGSKTIPWLARSNTCPPPAAWSVNHVRPAVAPNMRTASRPSERCANRSRTSGSHAIARHW